MIQERYLSEKVCCRVRRTRRDGLPDDTRLADVVVEVVEAGLVVPAVCSETGVVVELSAAPSFVVAAGRVVGVVPRAVRRDFLANSGISVGCAENGGK